MSHCLTLLTVSWRLFKRKKKKLRKKILLKIHFFFSLLAHFLNPAVTGKACARMQFGKVFIFVGVSALTGTRKQPKSEMWMSSPRAFQTSFTVLFCPALLPSKALTPGLLMYNFRKVGSIYMNSKINEDWGGEWEMLLCFWLLTLSELCVKFIRHMPSGRGEKDLRNWWTLSLRIWELWIGLQIFLWLEGVNGPLTMCHFLKWQGLYRAQITQCWYSSLK